MAVSLLLGGRPWKPSGRYNLVVLGEGRGYLFGVVGRALVEISTRKDSFSFSCVDNKKALMRIFVGEALFFITCC